MATDWPFEAHEAAEAHLNALADWEDHWEQHPDGVCDCPGAPPPEPDMAGPWCGCQTCTVREVLHAAWPTLQRAARAELVYDVMWPN